MTQSRLPLWLIYGSLLFPHILAQSTSCNRTCNSNNDCSDKLVCLNAICADDPNAGTTKMCGVNNVAGNCDQICGDHSDCPGQLACIGYKCTDDPFMPTQICGANNGCKVPCVTLDNCPGQLICINAECNDDPDVGTHTCDGANIAGMAPAPGITRDCNGTATTPCSNMAYSSRHVGAWNSLVWFLFLSRNALVAALLLIGMIQP